MIPSIESLKRGLRFDDESVDDSGINALMIQGPGVDVSGFAVEGWGVKWCCGQPSLRRGTLPGVGRGTLTASWF